jgi:hypothetical protein
VCVCTLNLNKLHLFHHYLLLKISSISARFSGKDRRTRPFKIHSVLSLKQFIDERLSDNISLSQYISRRGRKRPNFEAGNLSYLSQRRRILCYQQCGIILIITAYKVQARSKYLRRRDRGAKLKFNSSFFVI